VDRWYDEARSGVSVETLACLIPPEEGINVQNTFTVFRRRHRQCIVDFVRDRAIGMRSSLASKDEVQINTSHYGEDRLVPLDGVCGFPRIDGS
jgi:hypothetical protein